MAFDGFFCLAVAKELRSWTGAKVEKIHQSAPSCLYLCLYREGRHANLILSASASRPILAVTDEEIARPAEPTALCMLFRKHLQNGRLLAVDCVPNERIVCFRFESADELGFLHEKRIYAEMMGKYSNLILVGENGAVLAATSTADLTASVRQVMPGMPYELPPAQDKRDALQTDRETFLRLANGASGKRADQFLVQTFFSFSPAVAREVSFLAFERTDELLSEVTADRLWTSFEAFASLVREERFRPAAVYDGDSGVEYAFLPLTQYTGLEIRPYGSFSELQIRFFARREETVNIRSYASDILKKLKTLLAREQKKAGLLREEMNACAERETFRKYGDLLTANLYRLKAGMPEAEIEDYETGETVQIPMNVRQTPTQNAQAYYRRYAKMKRAEEALRGQIAETDRKTDYLESVLDAVDRAQELSDLEEIRREMEESGLTTSTRSSGGKNGKKRPLSKPLSFRTTDGKTVRVGKNNLQNDALDASAAKTDLWFHIKKYHGSHVILETGGEEPTDRDYTEAAMLAAFYSEKRGSRNVEVDYTRVRYLRKPGGSAPGFVTYETYYSAVVDAVNPFESEGKN